MYQKILADEALPLLKEQRTLYYKALYHLYKEQSSGYNGTMMPVAQAMAKQVYEDYDAAYRIMCAAAAGTDIKVGKYKANFEKDVSQVTKKSFEIGDYPYAALKELPGETHHITMPLEQYEDTTKHSAAAQLDEPYSVFLKGEEVTVSFKAAHEPIIKSAFLKNDGESIPVANRRPRQTTYEIE